MQGVDVAGDGRPATIQKTCEDSLRRLQTDVIDLLPAPLGQKRAIEDSVVALADMVKKGHIRSIDLSEVSAGTLRKEHTAHPCCDADRVFAVNPQP